MGREWQERGKCRKLSVDKAMALFFIKQGQSANNAKAYCADCPVRQECRDYAIVYKEEGIWGGTTDQERRALDELLGGSLRARARSEGQLESRRVDDFLPPKSPTVAVNIDELETLLQQVEQSEVLDLLCYEPTVPQGSAA